MASRRGWLLGEERSALYPAALMAAMTVKRLGLASMDPFSAAEAAAGREAIRSAITKRDNGLCLEYSQFTPVGRGAWCGGSLRPCRRASEIDIGLGVRYKLPVPGSP